MSALTPAERAAWARRLVGGSGETVPGSVPPDWLESSAIRLSGIAGMHQLSNMGIIDAAEPERFEAGLLRFQLGEVMLFSTLQTPHLLTFEAKPANEGDVVIIGLANKGGLRIRTPHGTATQSVGRMGFMSNVAPSWIEHIGINETTGLVLPLSAIRPFEELMLRGAALLPDTALTRASGVALSRLLAESLQTPQPTRAVQEPVHAMVLAIARSLLQQLSTPVERVDHAASMRADADRVIEERHREATFTVDDLARELHVSRRQLYRYFGTAEESVAGTLLRRRVQSAKESLLTQPPLDLESVASASGFSDAASLRTAFHRLVGTSPSEFRRAHRLPEPRIERAMMLTSEQEGR